MQSISNKLQEKQCACCTVLINPELSNSDNTDGWCCTHSKAQVHTTSGLVYRDRLVWLRAAMSRQPYLVPRSILLHVNLFSNTVLVTKLLILLLTWGGSEAAEDVHQNALPVVSGLSTAEETGITRVTMSGVGHRIRTTHDCRLSAKIKYLIKQYLPTAVVLTTSG